jgi:hypothetical protein
MIKLSFAAALILGANAISSDAKNKIASKDAADADLGDYSDIADIPLPTEEEQARINDYWKDKPTCQDLFEKLITIRKQINTDITEYRRVVADYNRDCKT